MPNSPKGKRKPLKRNRDPYETGDTKVKKTEIPLDRIAEHVEGQVVGAGGKIIRGVAIVGPRGGFATNVPDGQVVSGTPEMPHRTWLKVTRILRQLPELKKTELNGKRVEAAAGSGQAAAGA